MTRKRHTHAEIAKKLELADRLLQEGRTAGDVAAALGISKMTYHRWRSAGRTGAAPSQAEILDAAGVSNGRSGEAGARDRRQPRDLGQLQAENALLRRALGDLLVEKLKLEERLKLLPAS